jgi:hypothetical protein
VYVTDAGKESYDEHWLGGGAQFKDVPLLCVAPYIYPSSYVGICPVA